MTPPHPPCQTSASSSNIICERPALADWLTQWVSDMCEGVCILPHTEKRARMFFFLLPCVYGLSIGSSSWSSPPPSLAALELRAPVGPCSCGAALRLAPWCRCNKQCCACNGGCRCPCSGQCGRGGGAVRACKEWAPCTALGSKFPQQRATKEMMLLPACLLAPHPSKILPIPPPFSLSLSLATHQSVTQSKPQQCRDTAAVSDSSLFLTHSLPFFSAETLPTVYRTSVVLLSSSLCRSAGCRWNNQCTNLQI